MMVGHAALAFALGGMIAHKLGLSAERALLFAVAAGAFAVVPDVDMGYAFVGLATAGTADPSVLQQTFWDAGLTVHRGATHSLVVGGIAALGFGLTAHRRVGRAAGMAILASMVVLTFTLVGGLQAGVVASFVLAGVAVALLARRAGLGSPGVGGAALLGVLSHPFGDLFTGTAPQLFYPLDVRVLPTRLVLASDPTVHLLLAFGLELATIWAAITVYYRLRGHDLWPHVHRRAVLGAGYAAGVLALPPPTLDVSYHFVFTVLAVGVVGASVELPTPDLGDPGTRHTVLVTALTAITMALVAYTAAYLVVGLAPALTV